jgi:hemoglobin-like flavoprotein
MGLDVEALRGSFHVVVERQPDVVHRFYDILFSRYPQVRSLFSRNTRDKQERMLTQAIVAVLDHLEDAPWLESQLTAMGAKHVEYGVRDEMYGWVGESLVAALEGAAGDAWTPRVRQAWIDAFGAISGLMLAGARKGLPASGVAG